MFDLRYHVVSLVAVFIALVIGIVVGVGISGRGLLEEAERIRLQQDIDDLGRQNEALSSRVEELQAAAQYERESYRAVMEDRLAGKSVALVFVGSMARAGGGAIRTSVELALADAGAGLARIRVLRVPIDVIEVENAMAPMPDGPERVEDVGRALAQELLEGGDTPAWDALAGVLVEERIFLSRQAVDAVVVARTAEAQSGPTARFLGGFYNGLASGGRPAVAVAVDGEDAEDAGFPVFARYGFSTVNNVDTPTGRVTLAILLEGTETGHFGLDAEDGYVPNVAPVDRSG